jgi:hypothetical protein
MFLAEWQGQFYNHKDRSIQEEFWAKNFEYYGFNYNAAKRDLQFWRSGEPRTLFINTWPRQKMLGLAPVTTGFTFVRAKWATQLCGIHATRVCKKAQLCKYCQNVWYKINDCFTLKMDRSKLIMQDFLVTFHFSTLPLSLVCCPCAFDLKQLLLCCRNISNVYMKVETSHAFYNLVNCMSLYIFTLIPKISNKNTWNMKRTFQFRKFYREATASF